MTRAEQLYQEFASLPESMRVEVLTFMKQLKTQVKKPTDPQNAHLEDSNQKNNIVLPIFTADLPNTEQTKASNSAFIEHLLAMPKLNGHDE